VPKVHVAPAFFLIPIPALFSPMMPLLLCMPFIIASYCPLPPLASPSTPIEKLKKSLCLKSGKFGENRNADTI